MKNGNVNRTYHEAMEQLLQLVKEHNIFLNQYQHAVKRGKPTKTIEDVLENLLREIKKITGEASIDNAIELLEEHGYEGICSNIIPIETIKLINKDKQ